jgi:hypothetical protein
MNIMLCAGLAVSGDIFILARTNDNHRRPFDFVPEIGTRGLLSAFAREN